MTRTRNKLPSIPQQLDDHFDDVKRKFSTDGTNLIRDNRAHSEGKISDRISFLVDPLLQGTDAGEPASTVIGIACMAWNAILLKTPPRQAMIDEFISKIAPSADDLEFRVMTQDMIDEFMARKLKHFPNDKRFITSYKVIPNCSGFQLSIASVDPENQPG